MFVRVSFDIDFCYDHKYNALVQAPCISATPSLKIEKSEIHLSSDNMKSSRSTCSAKFSKSKRLFQANLLAT